MTSEAGKAGNIGAPCDVESGLGCAGQAVCLNVGNRLGVCVVEDCQPEQADTPAKEDDCPETTACSAVPVEVEGGSTTELQFCLPTCTPDPERNSCAEANPELGCDPLSALTNGHTAVCLLPACKTDIDCGSGNVLDPDARCDDKNGVCFNVGTPSTAVGSPCQIGNDCGPNQYCLKQRQVDGEVLFPGGYCTVIGCEHEGPWSCPAESKCFGIGSTHGLSLCLATGCEPGKPDNSCREGYECIEVDSIGLCWISLTP